MSSSVNNAAVVRIADAALAAEAPRPGEAVVDRVGRAFRQLQWRRRHVDPSSIDLAAAEHYMYARFLAGRTGDPTVRYAPMLYALKKRALFSLGLGQTMATTSQPVLPPDDGVEQWGRRGADEGLTDYRAAYGATPDNHGAAVRALADQALHYR